MPRSRSSVVLSRLSQAVTSVCGLLLPLAVLAAESDPNKMDPVEPFNPVYVILLLLGMGGILYWFYRSHIGGGNSEENKPEDTK